MTDKKLTDNEIVKALECCLDISPTEDALDSLLKELVGEDSASKN